MGNTSIQWTDFSFNPIRARRRDTGKVGWHCEAVSPGCANCYSETFNGRMLPNGGTGLEFARHQRDKVEIFLDEKILAQPLHWKKPRKIFVCSMTDLFAEFVPFEFIDRVFEVMALTHHTYQILTKRPERMLEYLSIGNTRINIEYAKEAITDALPCGIPSGNWPLTNVWLGVSVENQEYADKRIPLLLQTPAAKRFVSYEPALGPVDFRFLQPPTDPPVEIDALFGTHGVLRPHRGKNERLDWLIVGGESGPGARPFDLAWARSVIRQCRDAKVSCFVKQLGAKILPGSSFDDFAAQNPAILKTWLVHGDTGNGRAYLRTSDRKGGDMDEWPIELQVREFPR